MRQEGENKCTILEHEISIQNIVIIDLNDEIKPKIFLGEKTNNESSSIKIRLTRYALFVSRFFSLTLPPPFHNSCLFPPL